eukprot:2578041-Rhodomonas_salina.1
MPEKAGPGRKCCSACGQQVQKGDAAYLAVTCYHKCCTPDETEAFTVDNIAGAYIMDGTFAS